MQISFICSDPYHPVNEWIERWIEHHQEHHDITLVRKKSELPGGDILFLISCSEIIKASDRSAYNACLVLHASALPAGRGWSPYIWEVLQGSECITLSLLEAADKVDSGLIWKQLTIPIRKDALWDEITHSLFEGEIELVNHAVENFKSIQPYEQNPEIEPTYYRRRTPEDSKLDPDKSIQSQFDLIRVCDPDRFPAFFDLHGCRYKLTLEKIHHE